MLLSFVHRVQKWPELRSTYQHMKSMLKKYEEHAILKRIILWLNDLTDKMKCQKRQTTARLWNVCLKKKSVISITFVLPCFFITVSNLWALLTKLRAYDVRNLLKNVEFFIHQLWFQFKRDYVTLSLCTFIARVVCLRYSAQRKWVHPLWKVKF